MAQLCWGEKGMLEEFTDIPEKSALKFKGDISCKINLFPRLKQTWSRISLHSCRSLFYFVFFLFMLLTQFDFCHATDTDQEVEAHKSSLIYSELF